MAGSDTDRERRDDTARAAEIAALLPLQIARAAALPGYAGSLAAVAPDRITSREALAGLPVLRKAALLERQSAAPPLGGFTTGGVRGFAHIFQSPGPIYEPGQVSPDWWRFGRFLAALGIGPGDVVQNCFSYHLTPAGIVSRAAFAASGCSARTSTRFTGPSPASSTARSPRGAWCAP